MPLYDYRCDVCGATKTVLQKHDDDAPNCCTIGGESGPIAVPMQRALNAPAFALKGAGFYDGGRKVAGKAS